MEKREIHENLMKDFGQNHADVVQSFGVFKQGYS